MKEEYKTYSFSHPANADDNTRNTAYQTAIDTIVQDSGIPLFATVIVSAGQSRVTMTYKKQELT